MRGHPSSSIVWLCTFTLPAHFPSIITYSGPAAHCKANLNSNIIIFLISCCFCKRGGVTDVGRRGSSKPLKRCQVTMFRWSRALSFSVISFSCPFDYSILPFFSQSRCSWKCQTFVTLSGRIALRYSRASMRFHHTIVSTAKPQRCFLVC